MEKVDALDYLRDVDSKQTLSFAEQIRLKEQEDEAEVRRLCGISSTSGKYERRIVEDDEDDDDGFKKPVLPSKFQKDSLQIHSKGIV